jgi:hypothetical protein
MWWILASMATHFTFFGQMGGMTRQCTLCQEMLVVNASSKEVGSSDAHHLWSSAFERHIRERHSVSTCCDDLDSCATGQFVI